MTAAASETTVRALHASDRRAWLGLWRGYLRFYRADVPDAVTDKTFARLCERTDGLVGLLAVAPDDRALGLAHLVFHPATWADGTYCYLEDLYVDPDARGTGAGVALMNAVYEVADAHRAERVYWHTQEYNAPARSLYDQVGRRTSFVMYERPE
jgi:GNAT superfamily N-acetyltransferase